MHGACAAGEIPLGYISCEHVSTLGNLVDLEYTDHQSLEALQAYFAHARNTVRKLASRSRKVCGNTAESGTEEEEEEVFITKR